MQQLLDSSVLLVDAVRVARLSKFVAETYVIALLVKARIWGWQNL